MSFIQVLNLIEDQTKRVNQRIDALLMVGGFSASEYLFKRVEVSWTLGLCALALSPSFELE